MQKQEFEWQKELEELHHKNKMVEIQAEKEAKIEEENLKLENMKSLHRLKRADAKRINQEKEQFRY